MNEKDVIGTEQNVTL